MQDGLAPAFPQPRDREQLVADSGGEDQAGGPLFPAIAQRDGEAAVHRARRGRFALDEGGGRIGGDLPGGFPQDVVGRFAVVAEEAVRGLGEAVAGQAGVDHQHPPAGAGKLHRGGEAGKAAADDDGVKWHEGNLQNWERRRRGPPG